MTLTEKHFQAYCTAVHSQLLEIENASEEMFLRLHLLDNHLNSKCFDFAFIVLLKTMYYFVEITRESVDLVPIFKKSIYIHVQHQ